MSISSPSPMTLASGVMKTWHWQNPMTSLRTFNEPHLSSGLMERKKSDIYEYENGSKIPSNKTPFKDVIIQILIRECSYSRTNGFS